MKDEMKRYRFNVPTNDKSVLKWISNQSNVSSSIRQLIRDDIRRNGFSDYTCRDVMPFVCSDDVKSDENLSTIKFETENNIKEDILNNNEIEEDNLNQNIEVISEEIEEKIKQDENQELIENENLDDDSSMDDILASMLS